jgi:hypothetical protein
MAKKIIISGATGFIGRVLCRELIDRGYEVVVLSRNPVKGTALLSKSLQVVSWDAKTADGWQQFADGTLGIINLAGENIAGGRWTQPRKQKIIESRLAAGRAIVEVVSRARHKPRVVIQASGIGYYGSRGDALLDETSAAGQGFLADVAAQWEQTTSAVVSMGVRQVIIRTGIVLGHDGGFLSRILLPFKLFMGGHMGSGTQWLSWIHRAAEVRAICFLLERDDLSGAFNLCAPNPLAAREFFRVVGTVMGRPSWLPVPGFALRLMLGEMAEELILSGQRAVPRRLLEAGYHFKYPEAEAALQEILN